MRMLPFVLVLAACSGTSTTGSSSSSGGAVDAAFSLGVGATSGDLAFPVGSTFFAASRDGGPATSGIVQVALAEMIPGAQCGTVGRTGIVTRSVDVTVDQLPSVQPGTYDVFTGQRDAGGGSTFGSPGTVTWQRFDGTGGITSFSATSGSITFMDIGAASVRGSFSVAMDLGDGGTTQLSGSFDAPPCQLAGAAVGGH